MTHKEHIAALKAHMIHERTALRLEWLIGLESPEEAFWTDEEFFAMNESLVSGICACVKGQENES